jgi:hypothetical protein
MAPHKLKPFGRVGGFLQVCKKQFRVIQVSPIAVRELIPNAKADPDHGIGCEIFFTKPDRTEYRASDGIGCCYAARSGAQAIKCLVNLVRQLCRVSRIAAHRKFYLAETGQEFPDNLPFARVSIKRRIYAV